MENTIKYIAYYDLLGTRGFSDSPEIYFENIQKFKKAVTQTAILLRDDGHIGVFSDSVYVESANLRCMLDFLVLVRDRLMADGLFFNAVVKEGRLNLEEIAPSEKHVFGVAFRSNEIADLYIAQTNFKGVGIFVDDSITDDDVVRAGYSVNRCVYMERSPEGNRDRYIPRMYRDISLKKSLDNPRRLSNVLELFLKEFYSSFVKSPRYGAYYISLFTNFIRSFGADPEWDLTKKNFKVTPLIYKVICNIAGSDNKTMENLPGLEYLVFISLDMIYQSEKMNEHDKISATRVFANYECVRNKYFHNLNSIPEGLFSKTEDGDNREKFIRYCQDNLADDFVDNIINGT